MTHINRPFVDPTKLEYDIEIPVLTPAFSRSLANLDGLDVAALPVHRFQIMAISEDREVARKDMRAIQWCRDATGLSGEMWQFVKVPEPLFRSRPWRSHSELAAATPTSPI